MADKFSEKYDRISACFPKDCNVKEIINKIAELTNESPNALIGRFIVEGAARYGYELSFSKQYHSFNTDAQAHITTVKMLPAEYDAIRQRATDAGYKSLQRYVTKELDAYISSDYERAKSVLAYVDGFRNDPLDKALQLRWKVDVFNRYAALAKRETDGKFSHLIRLLAYK